jgi:hypothetical protein
MRVQPLGIDTMQQNIHTRAQHSNRAVYSVYPENVTPAAIAGYVGAMVAIPAVLAAPVAVAAVVVATVAAVVAVRIATIEISSGTPPDTPADSRGGTEPVAAD